MTRRFVRKREGGTDFEPVLGTRWPQAFDVHEEAPDEVYDLREVKAGTLVLIHGNLLHKSEKNESKKSRLIYTFHMIEGDDRHEVSALLSGAFLLQSSSLSARQNVLLFLMNNNNCPL